jgi:hypothetical protein
MGDFCRRRSCHFDTRRPPYVASAQQFRGHFLGRICGAPATLREGIEKRAWRALHRSNKGATSEVSSKVDTHGGAAYRSFFCCVGATAWTQIVWRPSSSGKECATVREHASAVARSLQYHSGKQRSGERGSATAGAWSAQFRSPCTNRRGGPIRTRESGRSDSLGAKPQCHTGETVDGTLGVAPMVPGE